MNSVFPRTVLLLAGLGLLTACGRPKTVGAPAPADKPAVPLATLLASPTEFDGQTVVLSGKVSAQCAARCDLTYTEGADTVSIHTDPQTTPKLATGQPVRVTASVHKGERQVVLDAVGLELLPKGGTP